MLSEIFTICSHFFWKKLHTNKSYKKNLNFKYVKKYFLHRHNNHMPSSPNLRADPAYHDHSLTTNARGCMRTCSNFECSSNKQVLIFKADTFFWLDSMGWYSTVNSKYTLILLRATGDSLKGPYRFRIDTSWLEGKNWYLRPKGLVAQQVGEGPLSPQDMCHYH